MQPDAVEDFGLELVRSRLRLPGDHLVSDVLEACDDYRRGAGSKQVPEFEAERQFRGQVLRSWRDKYVGLASEVLQLKQAADGLDFGREKRHAGYRTRNKKQELEDFERQIRLSERPLLKIMFEYEAALVG